MGQSKKRVLILSASERVSLDVAETLHSQLDFDFHATVWTQGVFKPGKSAYDSFTQAVEANAYGVFVLTPDDVAKIKGEEISVPRLNVVFELGYFAARHGIERAYFVAPRGTKLTYLSDLAGIQPIEFDLSRFLAGEQEASLGSAVRSIKRAIYEDTIRYPDQSHRRPNLLAGAIDRVKAQGDYCLAADLKSGQEVRLRITGTPRESTTDLAFGWGTSLTPTRIAWDNSPGIVNGQQTYRASGPAAAFTQFTVSEACEVLTIEVFEAEGALDEVCEVPVRTIVLPVSFT